MQQHGGGNTVWFDSVMVVILVLVLGEKKRGDIGVVTSSWMVYRYPQARQGGAGHLYSSCTESYRTGRFLPVPASGTGRNLL
jgi:hypothetical protein